MSIFSLIGCSSIGDLKSIAEIVKPKVHVTDAELKRISMHDVDLAVNLDIDNPNPVALKLSGFDYEIVFNNKQFSKGSNKDVNSISASGKSNVAVPINVVFSDLRKILSEFKTENELNYEIKTTAYLELPVIGLYPVASTSKGKLPVPQIPRVSVKKISLDKMNFGSVEFLVTLNVNNPNAFDVDISELTYNLTVVEGDLGKSQINKPIKMKKESYNEIEIPIKLNLINVSGALLQSFNNKSLSYRINGDMKFDTSLPMLKGVRLPFDYSAKVDSL